MANMDDKTVGRAQAVVTGELADGALNARAGTLEFTIGGHDGVDLETNPYELLSASLAACTAMTIRDRKSTRLNSSHQHRSRMPSSA